MKTYILYNNLSGIGHAYEEAQKISASLAGDWELVDITKIDDWKSFISPLDASDSLIICGGDGTLNRFVNDTDGIDICCDVLYFAIGTGNDFLRDIDKQVGCEPFSVKEYIKDLPCVEVNGKAYRFLNNVGFGIDGYCCEVGDALKAKGEKNINYTSIAIKGLLFGFKPVNATVTVDGVQHTYKKVWIAPTMKGRYYGGGMMPTPAQDRRNEDGKLSLMLLYGSGKLKTLLVFPSLFKGEHVKHTEMVAIHEGHDISVTFDRPTALQIDGETVLGVTSYHATSKVAALTK